MEQPLLFDDRKHAGTLLAQRLQHLKSERPIVLGLPRGGVPVASEIAAALGAPLDVIVVRKLGVPGHEELAMGAIGEGTARVLNDNIIRHCAVTEADLSEVEARERRELQRRVQRFRGTNQMLQLKGRTVLIVDDGIATGATMHAALQVARALGSKRIVLAVPVASSDTISQFSREADEVICLSTPPNFHAVGSWYKNFAQTTDDEVVTLLAAAHGGSKTRSGSSAVDELVSIDAGSNTLLEGHLVVPANSLGVVLFAHGSGSSRLSPRNKLVAEALHKRRIGTLLFDLLTPDEAANRANVFNIPLLASRLVAATNWIRSSSSSPIGRLPFAFFGASTGAAAALWAAADPKLEIRAVVSRGGRPDLAGPRLDSVAAPTLLIVGDRDTEVLQLNRAAAEKLHCEKRIELVEGATHLFEEEGTLERAAELAAVWFETNFMGAPTKA